MPLFKFDLTAMVPVTASVEIEAASIEEAHAIARKPSWFNDRNNVRFTVDTYRAIDDILMPGLSDHEIVRGGRS